MIGSAFLSIECISKHILLVIRSESGWHWSSERRDQCYSYLQRDVKSSSQIKSFFISKILFNRRLLCMDQITSLTTSLSVLPDCKAWFIWYFNLIKLNLLFWLGSPMQPLILFSFPNMFARTIVAVSRRPRSKTLPSSVILPTPFLRVSFIYQGQLPSPFFSSSSSSYFFCSISISPFRGFCLMMTFPSSASLTVWWPFATAGWLALSD